MEMRMPAVAGMFYPLNQKPLRDQLEDLFYRTKGTRPDCLGVISPHAGYEFSGLTAAHAVSSLKPVNRYIILGPNHHLWGTEFAVMAEGKWATPLGECRIDTSLARKLLTCRHLQANTLAHEKEHSIEVQLPFLQYKHQNPQIVPVSIMCTDLSQDFQNKCTLLGETIAKAVKGNPIGIIASTDFSHYLPLKEAEERDSRAVEQIENLDLKGFFRVVKETDASICGIGPIAVMVVVADRLGLKVRVIHKSTSADATGDKNSVVAYYAIGFY